MTAKSRWIFYGVILAFLAWQCVKTTVAAFSIPWHWSQDQVPFLLFLAGVAYVLGVWAFTWVSGGRAAVKARWAKVHEGMTAPIMINRSFWHRVFLWIVIAVALVFIFNMTQR